MGTLKVRETTWKDQFSPKHYLTADWQTDVSAIKARIAGNWEIFWPPGTSGATAISVFFSNPSPLNVVSFNAAGDTAEFSLSASGDTQKTTQQAGIDADIGDWITDKTGLDGSLYDVTVALVSGTLDSGILTVQNLSVQRTWGVTVTSGAAQSAVLDVTVKEIATPANTATLRVNLSADAS